MGGVNTRDQINKCSSLFVEHSHLILSKVKFLICSKVASIKLS